MREKGQSMPTHIIVTPKWKDSKVRPDSIGGWKRTAKKVRMMTKCQTEQDKVCAKVDMRTERKSKKAKLIAERKRNAVM